MLQDDRLSSKEAWRARVEPQVEQLDRILWSAKVDYGQCDLCQKPFGSLAAHVTGKGHFNKLWWKLNGAWPSSISVQDDLIQHWNCPDGRSYCFNHLSAEYEVRGQQTHACNELIQELAAYGLECTHCRMVLPKVSFHKPQQKMSLQDRICVACREAAQNQELAEYESLSCAHCRQSLPRASFHKGQQKWDLQDRICIACREGEWVQERIYTCALCEQASDKVNFRRNTDWNRPVCRECVEHLEQQEHEERVEDQKEQAEARQRKRDAMNEAELRNRYSIEIIAQAGDIPREHSNAQFLCEAVPDVQELWRQTARWASQLAQRVQLEMEVGRLSTSWQVESPSREHASDKALADTFKHFEDLGDQIVQENVAALYLDLVAGQQLEQHTLRELRQMVVRADGDRSWHLRQRSFVVAAIRPLRGWAAGTCTAKDLRAEPGSNTVHAAPEGFAQFDDSAHAALFGAEPLLCEGSVMEVKLFRNGFWSDVEMDLYGDAQRVGSHNRSFSRALGYYVRGTAAAANWTEVMNLFADLLGFADSDPNKPCNLGRSIWADHFGHLFPKMLEVCYGSGSEFKADKEWSRKKEANVAEALIGALQDAGLEELASAAACLCFLCYSLWPHGVLPSNWAMAEKVLAMKLAGEQSSHTVNDAFVQRHLDVGALQAKMEQWLHGGY